ncbi:class I SAM-dependent methyltransferase [Tuwongella immobilis]|uniref:Uncharacterized protein n=1 Tax=Tuwongella immobilis TaxID=692036 RepID=A0A6C2YV65_9BACT|nr:class I SAM-dependent methyltransferase [Tuwongella immobilis]VIP05396.1 methyltransferase : Putative O-methyltransferase OS=Nitrospirillum amazonense Y2 GN=AZA_43404 PE=4 SV=1: LCM [Tuwongella immobilis]VTS08148.1 methyltransferase : Putative O-methyltransferase OS=Nitrospirillum amazonense Y2 GN=AZA_43404 PE=4 SV=1: LCM [Tuwongella immobilis]
MMSRIPPSVGTAKRHRPALSGVPETMLWPLINRAAEARRPAPLLDDPEAIRIVDSLDYPFAEHFGPPDLSHVHRALVMDRLIRMWLRQHPAGQIVALGEGLETQWFRVDNGRLTWRSIDLPEAIAVRREFLPDTDRHQNWSGSALDVQWMESLDDTRTRPTLITAAGLLMYFRPEQVRTLIHEMGNRLPGVTLLLDVIPPWMSRWTLRGFRVTPQYTAPPMPWGITRRQLLAMQTWHPAIERVEAVDYFASRGIRGAMIRMVRNTPGLWNHLPMIGKMTFRRETVSAN